MAVSVDRGSLRWVWRVGVVTLLTAGCAVHAPTRRHEGVHLDVYCDLPGPVSTSLLAEADRHVERVAAFLRVSVPPKRLCVHVFPSPWSLTGFLVRACPRQWDRAAACFETSDGYVVAIARQRRREATLRSLRHELTHYVLASHFSDLPPWIDEGLAQYGETGAPFGNVPDHTRKSAMARVHRTAGRGLENLVAIPVGRTLTRVQYAQARALVCVLIGDDRFGLDRVLDYLRTVRSDGFAGSSSSAGRAREHFRRCFGVWPCDLSGSGGSGQHSAVSNQPRNRTADR